MKKFILFVLTLASLAGVFFLAKDEVLNSVKIFEKAFKGVEQWKTLM